MNITAPSTPPPPLTPEEEALVEESKKFWESMKNRPLVSQELQQRAADEPTDLAPRDHDDQGRADDGDDAPLI